MQINIILYHSISCLLDLAKEYLIIHYVIGFQKKSASLKTVFKRTKIPLPPPPPTDSSLAMASGGVIFPKIPNIFL